LTNVEIFNKYFETTITKTKKLNIAIPQTKHAA